MIVSLESVSYQQTEAKVVWAFRSHDSEMFRLSVQVRLADLPPAQLHENTIRVAQKVLILRLEEILSKLHEQPEE